MHHCGGPGESPRCVGFRKMRDTRNVAALIETSNAFARQTLHGVRQYMREHGRWTIRFNEQGRGSEPPSWLRAWKKADGILAHIENKSLAKAVAETGKPAVDVGGCRLLPSVPSVEVDPEAIARLAAEHLLERGFRHFAYCGVSSLPWSELRGHHFARLIAEAGHETVVYKPATQHALFDPWKNDQASVVKWIQGLPKPVGVLAAWDGCALQILEACRQQGVSVPDDVAVLGVDDDELLCDLADPPLSSVANSAFRIGYRAAALLDQMMAGEDVASGVHSTQPEGIVTRQSTDVLAVDDKMVSEAVQFIRKHACHGASVEDVLAQVPMTRRVLEARFKAFFGHTLHEELVQAKLRRVKELLTQTDLSLATLARQSGFNHVAYMCALFKQRMGVTLGEYRAKNRRG